jgi:hypothetical protein
MSRLRIIVLGYIVRGPLGGMAWHHLQYVLGLARLGHQVLFLEDSDEYPSCYDPSTHQIGTDPGYGLRFAEHAFNRLGLNDCWSYYDAHRKHWMGPAAGRAESWCQEADVVINVSGVNPLRPLLECVPIRVLIDTDPLFTQVRHLTDESARERSSRYNVFFSFGESIESGASRVPDDGFDWRATRQPIVFECWPMQKISARSRFTTVMQWDSYPPVEYAGIHFGMKNKSFEMVRHLPAHVDVSLEIALGGKSAPRDELRRLGWYLADPLAVTRDPWTYQEYIQNSCGEFSIAKHGYVASRCGWFSERTACYLATGRPAIVQNTGFREHLPCGVGILPFDDAESAMEAVDRVKKDYQKHSQAARELALEHFDSNKVLCSLLERATAAETSLRKR